MSVKDFEHHAAPPPLPSPHVIFTDLDGLEGVLVDLNTKKYYQLNETACLIWRGLEKHLPVSFIAKELTDRYEVTIEHATASIETALLGFDTQRLIGPRNPISKP